MSLCCVTLMFDFEKKMDVAVAMKFDSVRFGAAMVKQRVDVAVAMRFR